MRVKKVLDCWVTDDPDVLNAFIKATEEHYTELEKALHAFQSVVNTLEATGWQGQDSWKLVAEALSPLRQSMQECLLHFAKEQTALNKPVPIIFATSAVIYKCSLHYMNSKVQEATALLTFPSIQVLDKHVVRQWLRLIETLRELESATRQTIEKARAQLKKDEQQQLSQWLPSQQRQRQATQQQRPILRLVIRNDDCQEDRDGKGTEGQ
jgi:hypothetical protein